MQYIIQNNIQGGSQTQTPAIVSSRMRKEAKPKILIVDDQVFNINALQIILQYKIRIPESI